MKTRLLGTAKDLRDVCRFVEMDVWITNTTTNSIPSHAPCQTPTHTPRDQEEWWQFEFRQHFRFRLDFDRTHGKSAK
ncbi:uncharacterized protein BDW47DRAFT_114339 [Aspergillus candidus]|uniref:Uncharacterized protein n=1 Tax=Aspergillus candidus TaxID=41067 RepID=A0A2I2EY05_ASPCN|nr:hypothetical protein BDW47DRAFT_114339 [Aspergillus candidus]PLB33254.1 hypothetical protein BDW47DRAFT_114339 [Aspergillus candidus]